MERIFPQDINRFLGVMNLSSDSLIWHTLRNLFLTGREITCLRKRDLNSCIRNTKWNLLTLALVNFRNTLLLSGWNWRTPISDVQNLEESTTGRTGNERESTSRYSDQKRAQELRVDELSLQKLRESHDTIQKLTSQIQELQERVNCMNDSGEFRDTESNYSRIFHTFAVSTGSHSKSTIYV